MGELCRWHCFSQDRKFSAFSACVFLQDFFGARKCMQIMGPICKRSFSSAAMNSHWLWILVTIKILQAGEPGSYVCFTFYPCFTTPYSHPQPFAIQWQSELIKVCLCSCKAICIIIFCDEIFTGEGGAAAFCPSKGCPGNTPRSLKPLIFVREIWLPQPISECRNVSCRNYTPPPLHSPFSKISLKVVWSLQSCITAAVSQAQHGPAWAALLKLLY